MGTTILVCNQKGGTGKTMVSVHLAAWAAAKGMRAVAIDADPQGSLANWHERSKLAGLEFPDVLLLRPSLLRRDWAELTKRYEAIVIDTPPTASHLVEEFAPKVSTVVVPLLPSGLELHVLQAMLPLLPRDRLHLVLNRWDTTRTAREVREAVEALELPMSVVRDYVAFRDAALYGGTVLSRYPHGNPAEDIRNLGTKVWS